MDAVVAIGAFVFTVVGVLGVSVLLVRAFSDEPQDEEKETDR